MGFAIALAGMHVMALAIAGIDPTAAKTVFALEQTALALCALAWPPLRRALLDGLASYWPAALAFAGVLIITAYQSGLLGPGGEALKPFEAQSEVWNLAAMFFGVAVASAAAGAYGRRPVHDTLLAAALIFAAFDAIQKFQNGPTHSFLAGPGETGVVYALFALLAVFVAIDEIRSRSEGGSGRRRTPLGQRLLLPTASLAASLMGLALSASTGVVSALLAGLALMLLALGARDLRRPIGALLTTAGAVFGLAAIGLRLAFGPAADRFGFQDLGLSLATSLKGASGLGAGVEGGIAQAWPVETGVWGAATMSIALAALLALMARADDRRRSPARGLGLALGAFAVAAAAGPGGAAPTAIATLAVFFGLALSYADPLRPFAGARSPAGAPAAGSSTPARPANAPETAAARID